MPKLPRTRIFGEYSYLAARKVRFHPESICSNGGIGPSLTTEFSSFVKDRLHIQSLDSLILLKLALGTWRHLRSPASGSQRQLMANSFCTISSITKKATSCCWKIFAEMLSLPSPVQVFGLRSLLQLVATLMHL